MNDEMFTDGGEMWTEEYHSIMSLGENIIASCHLGECHLVGNMRVC